MKRFTLVGREPLSCDQPIMAEKHAHPSILSAYISDSVTALLWSLVDMEQEEDASSSAIILYPDIF